MTIPFNAVIEIFFESRKGYLVLSNIKGDQPVDFYFDHPDPRKRKSKAPKLPRPNKLTTRNKILKIQCIWVLSELADSGQALPKKGTLLKQVEREIRTKIPQKVFNDACGAVFPRKRGRPSKIK